ncbi:MAG: glycosyl hydrolase family 5 [Deltaproteobacteria bacterium]|nr:glycosyl hydrolase family 5 [Nannocystaceae bacterium]
MSRRAPHPIVLTLLACACPRPSTSTDDPERARAIAEHPLAPSVASPVAREPVTDGWTIEATDDGALRVRNRHADVIRSRYVFFEPGYRWANPEQRSDVPSAGRQPFEIEAAPLALRIAGVVAPAEHGLEITYNLALARALTGIPGGGLELDIAEAAGLWGGKAPAWKLSADAKTLELGSGDDRLELALGGDALGFVREPSAPGRVRAILVAGDMKAGSRRATLSIRIPARGKVRRSTRERYGEPAADWREGIVEHDSWPIDVSFLGDAPAGKHGKLRADGDALVFEDGTPARFWGTNVVAYALFGTDKAAIQRQAQRLAALGYNLVRLHHHDSPWVEPNIFEPGTRKLRAASLDALDWWIKCLAEAGIYVWLDLHVGRRFTPADAIAGFGELPDGDGRGFSYVDARIEALMNGFAEQYLDRNSRYTGRSLTDDPAVAFVLVTNENDVTHHFGQFMLPGSGRPVHEALLRTRVTAITKKTGLPFEQAMRTWEPGPAKLVLAEIEHAWDRRAISSLRKLGIEVPIVPTSVWGDESLFSVSPLRAGDVIDVHSYGPAEMSSSNPHFEPSFMSFPAMGALLGKPVTISEWNVPLPARDRFEAPLHVAAISALQGWDAPLLYCHVQDALAPPQSVSMFSGWVDPAITALMPAAAVMYRRGDIAPARETIVLAPSEADAYGRARNPFNSAALRTGFERSRVVIALPDSDALDWDKPAARPAGATVVTDMDRDLLPEGSTRVVSDTGEIARDFAEGIINIASPRSQAAIGWIGGARVELQGGWVELDVPKAAFALTALDAEPIASSKKILVTAVAQAVPAPSMRGPFRSEPVRGRFAIRTAQDLVLVPLSGRSASAGGDLSGRVPIEPRRDGESLVFELDARVATHWWIAMPRAAAPH